MRMSTHGAILPAVIFLSLVVGIGSAGYVYYESQKQAFERNIHDELFSIAQLKVGQIEAWRKELLEDASLIEKNFYLARGIQAWLENPADRSNKERLSSWMASLAAHSSYGSVLLTDSKGNILLSAGGTSRVDGSLTGYFDRVSGSKAPVLSHLYRSEAASGIRLCLFAPVLDPQNEDAPIIGIILIEIDPYQFLYPYIQSWPTFSKTAETLLVRRKGNEVLFLNELRHKKDSALSLRFPLSEGWLPAARAVQGEDGIVSGVDYRGVPVLASIRPVADSPWLLIAKMDRDEVYAPLRERGVLVALTISILICAAAVSFALVWSRRVRGGLERQVQERTEELKKANEALKLDELRLQALLELSRMSNASIKDIMDFALEQQVGLTRSQIGSLGFMSENETIFTHYAWSSAVEKLCAITDKSMEHQPIDEAGIWAEAVRKRKPIIVNDFSAPNADKRGYPAGHIPLSRIMSIPVFDGDQIVAVAIVANKACDYDPSDVRQLTLLMDGMWKLIQRSRAEKTLREAENLASMGKALSGLAHDIKTPLVAIGGFARLVRNHIEEGSPDREKLDIVLKETERLESMVKHMLDFSRPLELNRSMEDINRLIEESLVLVEAAAAERKVALENEPAPNLPMISIDSMRMKQVLINLVMNAIQASPEGERVRVSTRGKKEKLVIDVADCGCGIPVEKRDEVFVPFVSTKKNGTGLGLPIVKKIVEAHQGRMEILDNPERGVTFRVVIPLIGEGREAGLRAYSGPQPTALNKAQAGV